MSTTGKKPSAQRTFHGTVISDRSTQTIIVAVEQHVRHPLYGKRYQRTRKFTVHDPQEQYQIGDVVEFVPCRPISKQKRWRVIYPKTQAV